MVKFNSGVNQVFLDVGLLVYSWLLIRWLHIISINLNIHCKIQQNRIQHIITIFLTINTGVISNKPEVINTSAAKSLKGQMTLCKWII